MLEPAIQDKRRWWSREDLLLLVLLGALFFLPGLGQIPVFDQDEPRFAAAARQMVQSGDYVIPRYFNGAIRPDKPPLIYWMMDAAYGITGSQGEFASRLPSAFFGTCTLLVVYFMVGMRFGRPTGFIAALILGSCGVFVTESRMATADATMLFFIVVCMACAWQAWDAGQVEGGQERRLPRADYLLDRSVGRDGDEKHALALDHLPVSARRRVPFALAMLFWISLALGALTKGVPLLFVGVPLVMLSIGSGVFETEVRRWRSHLHVGGARIGIAIAVVVMAVVVIFGNGVATEYRWWAGILGVLLTGMVLTPGLPWVGIRCLIGGNWGWLKQLRPLLGVPLLIGIIALWAVPAGMREPELLKQMVGVHFLERVAGPLLKTMHITLGEEASAGGNVKKYSRPPGFYLGLVWVTFWPWSVLLIPTAYYTVRRMLGRTALAIDPRPYQFLVAWVVPMWVLLELARGKLPHYTMPTYVGISILCADALVQGWQRMTDVFAPAWFAQMRWVVLGIWCALAGGVLFGADRLLGTDVFWECVPFAGALVAAGVAGAIAWNRITWPFIVVMGWAAALMIMNAVLLPQLSVLQVSMRAGHRMAELERAEPDFHMAAAGYTEVSLEYYAGVAVKNVPHANNEKQVKLEDSFIGIPFVTEKHGAVGEKWLIALDDAALAYLKKSQPDAKFYVLGKYEGYNSGNWTRVTVTLISNVIPKEDQVPPETMGNALTMPSP